MKGHWKILWTWFTYVCFTYSFFKYIIFFINIKVNQTYVNFFWCEPVFLGFAYTKRPFFIDVYTILTYAWYHVILRNIKEWMNCIQELYKSNFFGAWVICEPWFTGSREICELWKIVNLKKVHITCEPTLCEPILCELFLMWTNLYFLVHIS